VRFYERALKAAKTDAPVKGVLSEGDRKALPSPAGARTAAPPLREPMGQTLFGPLCSIPKLEGALPSKESLDRLYKPIQDLAARLLSRSRMASAKRP